MAKIKISSSKVFDNLFSNVNPTDIELYRAWVEDGCLVLDLRGPSVPDVEWIKTITITEQKTSEVLWTVSTTKFVDINHREEQLEWKINLNCDKNK